MTEGTIMEKNKESLSRRSFLKGVSATSAAAAMIALGGCAPKEVATAEEAPVTVEPGTRWSWETTPEPIPDSEISETIDTELCVVGLGVAGAAATLAGAHSGSKVVTLQKSSHIQTNGWCVGCFNSKIFLDAGQTYDLGEIHAQWSELSAGRDNAKVVDLFLKRSGEVVDFVIDYTPEKTPIMQKSGHTYGWYINNDMSTRYAQFREMLGIMVDKATALGAEVYYSTPATRLVQDETGAITGVIAQKEDGSYLKVNASKGVVLATGDLSDDEEMLECYAPHIVGIHNMHSEHCNTGDGHKMGMWVGADIDPSPHGIHVHWDPGWLPEGGAPYSGIPWLRVNLNGERFANEDMGYQSVVTAASLQPERLAFQILDSNWREHTLAGDYKHNNSHSRGTADPEKDWQDALDRGAIIQADTLEELADAYGINKENLLATVARYNELVEKGHDEDFGMRGDYLSWNAIKEPPFFAIKRAPGTHGTMGGLKVNDKLEVLDKEGNPITGLYASGNVSGSFYGYDYPLFITGGSNGRALTFGALAARSALGLLDEPLTL